MKRCIYLFLLFFLSCSKQDLEPDCKDLKEGIINDDSKRVGSSISNFIAQLGNKAHTRENLIVLAQRMSNTCSLNVNVLCYGCIETLPVQSELKVSFSSAGTTITKVIDISENTSGQMKFSNMHD